LWALGSLPLTEWTNAYPDRRFEEKGGWGITRKWKPKEQNTVGINVQKAHASSCFFVLRQISMGRNWHKAQARWYGWEKSEIIASKGQMPTEGRVGNLKQTEKRHLW